MNTSREEVLEFMNSDYYPGMDLRTFYDLFNLTEDELISLLEEYMREVPLEIIQITPNKIWVG